MTAVPPGVRLRSLGFFGPQKPRAVVTFGPGMNVVYGASNAGKSFIVEAIDFMLGGGQALRDIPERVGYDRVLLGLAAGVEILEQGFAQQRVQAIPGFTFGAVHRDQEQVVPLHARQ